MLLIPKGGAVRSGTRRHRQLRAFVQNGSRAIAGDNVVKLELDRCAQRTQCRPRVPTDLQDEVTLTGARKTGHQNSHRNLHDNISDPV